MTTPLVGHPGQWRTTELVYLSYWWLGMGCYIIKYVKACDKCNHTKTFPPSPISKLLSNYIPDHKWQVISVDLIIELPASYGQNALLVVVDCLSKHTHIIPTTSDVNSVGIARLFLNHVWKLHSLPEEVISNHATQFISQFMCELYVTVRGCPSSHFCHSKLCSTFNSELHSTFNSKLSSAFELELCSAFTSGAASEAKQLRYEHPGSVRDSWSAGLVGTE